MCMGSVCLISIVDLPTTSPSIVLVLPCSGTPWHCMVCKDTLIYNYIYLIQSHQLWYLLGVQKNIYNILVFWIEITVLSNHWQTQPSFFWVCVIETTAMSNSKQPSNILFHLGDITHLSFVHNCNTRQRTWSSQNMTSLSHMHFNYFSSLRVLWQCSSSVMMMIESKIWNLVI